MIHLDAKTRGRLLWAAFEGVVGESCHIVDEARVRRKAFEAGLEAGLARGYGAAREDVRMRADLWLAEHEENAVPGYLNCAREMVRECFDEPVQAEIVDGD